jgi:cysteine desulfurase
MMGHQDEPEQLFYAFRLDSHVPSDHLLRGVDAAFGNQVVLHGHPEHRLPNTLNVSFVGCVGADILAQVPNVAASTGSACHSGETKLSPVLQTMGIAPEVGMGAIRFRLGVRCRARPS